MRTSAIIVGANGKFIGNKKFILYKLTEVNIVTLWFLFKTKLKLLGVYDISINYFTGKFEVTPLVKYSDLSGRQKEACDELFSRLRDRILGE